MNLMQFATDKKISSMNYLERKNAYKWVQDHFTIISNNQVYSYSDLMVFMEKVMRQQQIDAVFIDPYNSLRLDLKNSGVNSHEYHYEAASELLTFSKTNNVAVWLNMHAVTEAQRRKGDDGLPIAPYAVQSQDPAIRAMSEVHVRKVREVETGGRPTPLDSPYRIIMNSGHTGFTNAVGVNKMFQPIDLQPEPKRLFKDNINIDFLKNTV